MSGQELSRGGLVLRAGVATDVGRVRRHNEDCALAEGTVFVVADGMGGHAAGEVASGIVIETMRELAGRRGIRSEDVIAQLRLAGERAAHELPAALARVRLAPVDDPRDAERGLGRRSRG